MWPDRRLLDLLGMEHPVIQAPMAGAQGSALAAAVSEAGGLGSLPCGLFPADYLRQEVQAIRRRTTRPFNLNFFCYAPPEPDEARAARWVERLAPYRRELGIDAPAPSGGRGSGRGPFGDESCALIEDLKPPVVSFHFGFPPEAMVARVKAAGARVIASATTVEEARWLAGHGADAIIAQGVEGGGHRAMFLTDEVASQPGTMALVPQVVDAVRVPVIAAGGIGDARGIAAALMLGAAGAQIGTAYLLTPEATIPPIYRTALKTAREDQTAITNVFTGRPARGIVNRAVREIGPISADAPAFPGAMGAMLPLRLKAEAQGSGDFTSLWAGQALRFAREMPAGDLTRELVESTLALIRMWRAASAQGAGSID